LTELYVIGPQGIYPMAETFELRGRESIETVYQFYAYDWITKLQAKLGLAPADAGTYLVGARSKCHLSANYR